MRDRLALFWGIGAFCAGYHEARNSQPRYIIDDVQVHYGLGDVASLVLNSPFAAIPILGGLGLALLPRREAEADTNPKLVFIKKQATPTRLYALGFFAGAAFSAASDPLFAGIKALWGWGYIAMGKNENADRCTRLHRITQKINSKPAPRP